MTIIFGFNSAPPLPFSGHWNYRKSYTFIHRITDTHTHVWHTDMQWSKGCQNEYPKTPVLSGLLPSSSGDRQLYTENYGGMRIVGAFQDAQGSPLPNFLGQ